MRFLPTSLLLCSCLSAGAALTDQLAAYYDFQSNVNDQSGNGRHLTVATGTPEAGWPGGIVTRSGFSVDRSALLAGNALNLVDEDNDVLKAPLGSGPAAITSGTLNLAGTFTISAWHSLTPLPNNTSTRYFVFEAEDNFDVSWGISSGTTYAAYNAETAVGTASLATQVWHHVVHVFETEGNATTMTLYVDGEQKGSLSISSVLLDFDRIVFGDARDSAGDREWDGLLDEIAVWSRALTPGDVSELYLRGRAGLGVTADLAAAGKALFSLQASPANGGTVDPPAMQLVDVGVQIPVLAQATSGWLFQGWTGGLAGQPASFTHTVNASVSSIAAFAPDLTDVDDDGLTAHDEITLHGTNPALPDTDSDGIPDGGEILVTRTNPVVADNALFARINEVYGPGNAGGVALSALLIETPVPPGQVAFRLGFEGSADQTSWSSLDLDAATLQVLPSGTRFRITLPAPSSSVDAYPLFPARP